MDGHTVTQSLRHFEDVIYVLANYFLTRSMFSQFPAARIGGGGAWVLSWRNDGAFTRPVFAFYAQC